MEILATVDIVEEMIAREKEEEWWLEKLAAPAREEVLVRAAGAASGAALGSGGLNRAESDLDSDLGGTNLRYQI